MDIEIDYAIREKWHKGFMREEEVSEIVIHGTGGGATYNWVLNGGRKDLYQRGIALFHYLIERDGRVVEIIDPDRWVYHSSSGRHDEKTIGIELVNLTNDNSGHYTMAQYNSLFHLIFFIIFRRYKISTIAGHGMNKHLYSGGYKKCPGKGFDWDMLEKELTNKGYHYKKGKEIYEHILLDYS